MSAKKQVTPSYSFDSTVFVKFLDRTDFKLAKYNDISLEGFSCFCNKELTVGDHFRVEINLKMISGGMIDDLKPHIATATLLGKEAFGDTFIYRFQFINFEDHCFTGLAIATEYLDNKEKHLKLTSLHDSKIDDMSHLSIEEIIEEISEKIKNGQIALPVLPRIVQDVETVIKEKDCSIEDLAAVVEKDAVIASKLISIANSPFYRGSSYIISIKETIPRLGFAETRNLVLIIANKRLYSTNNIQLKQLFEKLWSYSLFCAYAAREIALAVGVANGEALFTFGLIKNIGQTLLIRLLSEALDHQVAAQIDGMIKHALEQNSYLTRLILERWNFADDDIESIVKSGETVFDESTKASALILNLADHLACISGFGIIESDQDLSAVPSLKRMGLDIEKVQEIGEKMKTMLHDSGNVF
jgi:HD-like signal output (HDOD) protein